MLVQVVISSMKFCCDSTQGTALIFRSTSNDMEHCRYSRSDQTSTLPSLPLIIIIVIIEASMATIRPSATNQGSGKDIKGKSTTWFQEIRRPHTGCLLEI